MQRSLATGVFQFDAPETMLLGRAKDGLDGLQTGGLAHAGRRFAHVTKRAVEVAGVGDVDPGGERFGLAGEGLGGTAVGLDELLLGQFGVDGLATGLGRGESLPAFPGGLVEDAGTARGVGAEDEVEVVGEWLGVGGCFGVRKGGRGGNGR